MPAIFSLRLVLLLLVASCAATQSARAGNIFLTGHDMLLHQGQQGYDIVVLDYLRNGSEPAATYSIAVIGSGAGGWAFSSFSQTPTGYPAATYYDTALLDGDPALQTAAVGHDLLIILSHTSCGGCDLTTIGSNVINGQMAGIIASAFNTGMDLWANSGALLPTYYDFLPPAFVATGTSISGTQFCPNTAGAALGITTTHTQGFPTHNSFPSFQAPLVALETDCPMDVGTNVISLGALGVTIPCCDADVNGDGVVDLTDFSFIQACFNLCPPSPGCLAADVNCDGCVDALDLDILTCQLAAGVPDPGCCTDPAGCLEYLDFEDLADPGAAELTQSSPYTHGAYEVHAAPLQTYGTSHGLIGASTAVHGDRLSLERSDMTSFHVCTLDLTELAATSVDSQSFLLFNGSSASPTWESFPLDGVRYQPESFAISAEAISVVAAGNRSQIDNVCICEESGLGSGDTMLRCVDPPSSLVAWWTGDGGGSGNSYFFAHHGTFTGTLPSTPPPPMWAATAMAFDATIGSLVVPASNALVPGTGDMTIAFWVRMAVSAGVAQFIEVSGAYDIRATNGLPSMTAEVSGQGTVALTGSTSIAGQGFHFIAARFDRTAGIVEFYVDGVLEDSAVLGAGQITAASDLTMGVGLDGQLDEVQIFSRALDPAELEVIRFASFAGQCKTPIYLRPAWDGPSGSGGVISIGFFEGIVIEVPFAGGSDEEAIAIAIADAINADPAAASLGIAAVALNGVVYVTPASVVSASTATPGLTVEVIPSGVVAGLVPSESLPTSGAPWIVGGFLLVCGAVLLARSRQLAESRGG